MFGCFKYCLIQESNAVTWVSILNRAKVFKFGNDPYVVFSNKPLCQVEVGRRSYSTPISPISILAVEGQKLVIGSYTSIAGGVKIIMAGGHFTNYISTYPFREMLSKQTISTQRYGDILIGNDVWIGEDATLIGGCQIGDGAIVGAKSLVTSKQSLDSYGIYGGVPAKLLRYRFPEKTRKELQELKWWNLPDKIIKEHSELFYSENIQESIEQLRQLTKSYPI